MLLLLVGPTSSAPGAAVSTTSGATVLLSALIAAAVSILITAGTQLYLARREEVARRYERRRVALTDAHDAARILRDRTRELGRVIHLDSGERSEHVVAAEARFDDANSHVDVLITRIDSPEVNTAIEVWRDDARVALISTVGETISDATEREHWARMNAVIGSALKSKDGLPTG